MSSEELFETRGILSSARKQNGSIKVASCLYDLGVDASFN